jgi:hypothetical protein
MREKAVCLKCGSEDLHIGAELSDRFDYAARTSATVRAYENPDAFLFKGPRDTNVVANVCIDCGFIEFYATNPKVFQSLKTQ